MARTFINIPLFKIKTKDKNIDTQDGEINY
jgi:hypothetical protein